MCFSRRTGTTGGQCTLAEVHQVFQCHVLEHGCLSLAVKLWVIYYVCLGLKAPFGMHPLMSLQHHCYRLMKIRHTNSEK